MTNPTLITTPFAENGDKNIIPESVGANPQNATMQAGFPPITQQKISEGGIPPERNDFNGILNLYGQHIVHINKGLPYEFDQDFANKIGGYPLNARLMLNNGDIVQSTVANNVNNPNSDMTGWVKVNAASQIVDESGLSQQELNNGIDSANKLRMISAPKGTRVYLNSINEGQGEGGGFFVATQKSGLIDNGGTIFSSPDPLIFWVRVDYDYVTPEMFGATPTGDNYIPVQKAIDFYPRGMGEVRLNRFYDISIGILIPPRLKVVGIGKDSCGFKKYTHDYLDLPDRQWQTMIRSYNYDFIIAIDIDNDVNGDLSGDQIRSTTLQDFSCICTAPMGLARFGCYTFETYHFVMRNVEFKNVTEGVRAEGWLWTMDNVSIRYCTKGFTFPNGGTSFQCNNLYVKYATEIAYDLKDITYSTFTTCCADFSSLHTFKLDGVNAVSFVGCGAEESSKWLFHVVNSKINVSSFRIINNVWGANIIAANWIQNSEVTFTNLYGSFHSVTGNNTDKPFLLNDAKVTLINSTYPALNTALTNSQTYDFGALSKINLVNERGFSTLMGQSGVFYEGYILNDIFTITSDYSAPVFVDSFLQDGTVWRKKTPNADLTALEWRVVSGAWVITSRASGTRSSGSFNGFAIPKNSSVTKLVGLVGAAIGDTIAVSIDKYVDNLSLTAQVSAENTVAVKFHNTTEFTMNIPDFTVNVVRI